MKEILITGIFLLSLTLLVSCGGNRDVDPGTDRQFEPLPETPSDTLKSGQAGQLGPTRNSDLDQIMADTLSSDPQTRNRAFLDFIKYYSEDDYPQPYRNLEYQLYPELYRGVVTASATAEFQLSDGSWKELSSRGEGRLEYLGGKWNFTSRITFDVAGAEEDLQKEKAEASAEQQKKEQELVRLNNLLAAFDFVPLVADNQKVPFDDPENGFKAPRSQIRLANTTGSEITFLFRTFWEVVSYSPETSKCTSDYRPRKNVTFDELSEWALASGELKEDWVKPDGFYSAFCIDFDVLNVWTVIEKVEGFDSRERIQAEIARIQAIQ